MPITYDKTTGRWRHRIRRNIAGQRVRLNKLLPKGWTRAQAQAHDDRETPRILAAAAGIGQRDSPQIERAVILYLTQHVPRLKSAKGVHEHLAAIFGWYQGKTFADLPAIARDYAADMQDTLAAATIRMRIALVRAACRYGWKMHAMGDADPGARIPLPAVRNQRQVYLDRREVLQAARILGRGDQRTAVLVAYYTGMRLAEILAAQISPARRGQGASFTLADTKNGQPRHVPIHPRIAVYARRGWPITEKRAWIQRGFLTATRALGLIDIHFHDLRHSAASAMINAEVDLYTVGAVLGHKSPQSTARYAHLAQGRLRDAINRIGQKSGPSPNKKAA